MAWLTEELQRRGATLVWSTEITGWRTSGARIEAAKSGRGDIPAEEFVLAAGAWSSRLARGLDVRIPLQAGKGYSLTHPGPRKLPSIPTILVEARVAVTPMGSSLRFAGTMEIAGLDLSIHPARVRGILKSLPRYYPDLGPEDFRDLPAWRGLRPCSPDGLPYLGRCRGHENLIAATGHAMLGLSLGPITGKLASEILSGEKPSIDVGALSPDRYS